ncbi:hypothetical protein [Knoellia sp. Soil729]|uniref:hypothetical protein n=1 Tax=Knoellia sp. Soil729 TaxID=1736394 RepID=UPI0006F2822D|nr:hypothetical protein [Knoellia sp. Soil729]KRE41014.1 hypothetical protein ASG74_14170 [Knoellia sp. Soil729]
MTWLAVWLLGVGVSDLLRAVDHRRVQRLAVPVGALTVLLAGLLGGLTGVADIVAMVAALVPLTGWVLLSERSLRRGGGHVEALLLLGGTALALVVMSGLASQPGGLLGEWLTWADLPFAGHLTVARLLLVAGFFVANLATGNVIVRLVLVSVGALRPSATAVHAHETQPSEKLKGGRLLGPMERIFILGLGLAGQITAASIVIAAKGLIRFPELQSAKDDTTSVKGDGIDEVTEYFLVGSFVSWLVALGSLALTR